MSKTPLTNTIGSQGKFYHKCGSSKPHATLWEKNNVEAFPEFEGFIAKFYSHMTPFSVTRRIIDIF